MLWVPLATCLPVRTYDFAVRGRGGPLSPPRFCGRGRQTRLPPSPLQPIIRQQLFERDDVVNIQHDRRLRIRRIELSDKLPASAARWQYAVGVNGHDRGDLRFPVLEHLGDRAVLGAEPDAAGHIETNPRVDVPAGAAQGGADLPRLEVLAERQDASHVLGGLNEL